MYQVRFPTGQLQGTVCVFTVHREAVFFIGSRWGLSNDLVALGP
jgi:hypothetical protein